MNIRDKNWLDAYIYLEDRLEHLNDTQIEEIVSKLQELFLRKENDAIEYVDVDINISDSDLLTIAKAAHNQNITLNDFIVNALQKYIMTKDKGKLND